MSKRKVNFEEGEYYHIYNRGNNKQKIFLDDKDRDRFLKLLYLSNSNKNIRFREQIVEQGIEAFDFDRGKRVVSVGAYVLMPNHFHIYVKVINSPRSPKPGMGEDGVVRFMNKIGTAYAKYFNKRHNRTGTLFEGRFKSVHVANDVQAKYLFSYIHLNPLKLIYPKSSFLLINSSCDILDISIFIFFVSCPQ